jgi:hypothetical protein
MKPERFFGKMIFTLCRWSQNQCDLSRKALAITLPAGATDQNFLGGGDPVCFHCINVVLDSGVKW